MKILTYMRRILHFGSLYKDFLIGNDIGTFVTNIETMLIKSNFEWLMVYNPDTKTHYFKVKKKEI